MSKSNFSEEFKRDAASDHRAGLSGFGGFAALGVSQHSLYEWKKKFSSTPGDQGNDQAEEIRRLKKELARVTEERGILKKATAYFARDAK
ncbi:transposase [Rhizobium setariae]|uniref:transposase n=1 Tax=Rhizobium setariae TaxID=2801340 RepID=UPI003CCF21FA